MRSVMRILVVFAMPGLMFASMATVHLRDLCETPNYSSGLLNVLTPVLPECNAWPGWSAVMWFVMTAALVAVAFGIRSARRPDWRATP